MDIKKMLAVGAAVVGTVAMADGIVSSSVVGYASNQLDDDYGAAYLTPQFVGVSDASGLTLGSITPVSSDAGYTIGEGDVDLQFLDNGGYTIQEKWFYYDGAKWRYNAGANKDADASDFVIPAGQGALVGCAVDPDDAIISFQSAGQVGTSDTLTTLDDDYGTVLAGNPFPVTVKLGQLSLEVDDGNSYAIAEGDVDLQFLDNGGYTIQEKWFYYDGAKWRYNAGPNKDADASEFEIPAGQGVLVGCAVDPDDAIITLRVPAPAL